MNKEQFLAAIKDRLSGLPQRDVDQSLDYYAEMISDHMEDGLTEEQAVEAMGTVDEVVSQILMDTPLPKLVKAKAHPDRKLRIWEAVLLVLGFPIWGSILLAAIAVFLAVYIVIWSIVITLYAVDLSFAAGGIAGIAGSVVLAFTGNQLQALLFLGAGLICAGIAILLFFTFNQGALGVVKLSKRMLLGVKSLFLRKGDAR